jgi:hypothetical protein
VPHAVQLEALDQRLIRLARDRGAVDEQPAVPGFDQHISHLHQRHQGPQRGLLGLLRTGVAEEVHRASQVRGESLRRKHVRRAI